MLTNSKEMLLSAKKNNYAIAQFNINNLEWTKYILEEMNNLKAPVILGVSEGTIQYMGGYKTIVNMINGLIADLKIEIPVCIHLDHGSSIDSCIQAIDAGFTSVMIDASKYPLPENIRITRQVVLYAHANDVTVEAEVGHIGGNEDGVRGQILNATLEDCLELVKATNVDSLAPALGSVHGLYKGELNLDFEIMKQINKNLEIPLVLHGGTGISDHKIKQAISCGISKININTELQLVWYQAVKEYITENNEVYDPRKVIASGEKNIKDKIREKQKLFMNQQIIN
ncbi:MAG: class II fructose-1,6-bisphosphate aldolase [bacterium]|nr:class II fructose-1,6-bisphosphate aldolase [bacterium]